MSFRVKRLDSDAAASWSGADRTGGWFGTSQDKHKRSQLPMYRRRLKEIDSYWDEVLIDEYLPVTFEGMLNNKDQQLDIVTNYMEGKC